MQLSVDFPGIHAIFCGFSQVFLWSPCNFLCFFPSFSVDIPGFSRESVHLCGIFPGFSKGQVLPGKGIRAFSVDFPRFF